MRRIKGCFSSVAEEMACGYNIVNIHSVATTCKEDLCIGIFSHHILMVIVVISWLTWTKGAVRDV